MAKKEISNFSAKKLDLGWLKDNGYQIDIPNDKIKKILLVGYLVRNLPPDINEITDLLEIITNVKKSWVYLHRKDDFALSPSDYSKYMVRKSERFKCNIVRKSSQTPTKFKVDFKLSELMPENKPKGIISVERAKIDQDIYDSQNRTIITLDTIADVEEVCLKICQEFASGRISLYDSCNKYGLNHLDFVKYLLEYDGVKTYFMDAVNVQRFLMSNDLRSITYMLLYERLTQRNTLAEKKRYQMVWVNDKQVEVQVDRTVDKKDLAISELTQVLNVLGGGNELEHNSGDEFSKLSEEEIQAEAERILLERQKN